MLNILLIIKSNIEQRNKNHIYKNMLLTVIIHNDANKTYQMLSEMLQNSDSISNSDDLFISAKSDLDKLQKLKSARR